MKRFFKIILGIFALIALGVVIFVAIRIRANDQKAAVRQAEAEKIQVSQAEAQQLDLGGFQESDFRLLLEPVAGTLAPTREQWQALHQAFAVAPDLAQRLPMLAPVASSNFGPIRYAAHTEGWRVLIDCRPEAATCKPVALAVSRMSEAEANEVQESINTLAQEGTAVYAALHAQKGTEGMDKLIKEGNIPMIYNEFCSDLGCNGSITFAVGNSLVKVEGSGDLQPWFTAMARSSGEGGRS